MASPSRRTEVSQDIARESLLEISQSTPEKTVNSNQGLPDFPSGNLVNGEQNGGAEEYRTKLISISYQSPETKPTPCPIQNASP